MGGSASKDLEPKSTPYKTAYEVEGLTDIDGNPVDLKTYAGKVILIVNIATANKQSQEQLDELAILQEKYGPEGLQILLFPSDDFHHQPQDVAAVKEACAAAVSKGARVMQFVSVKGAAAHPLFVFLKLNDPEFKFPIQSDLCKILVNRKGGVFIRCNIRTMPHALDAYVARALHGALTQKTEE